MNATCTDGLDLMIDDNEHPINELTPASERREGGQRPFKPSRLSEPFFGLVHVQPKYLGS